MFLKDINPNTSDSGRLIYNDEYYRNIFKKTEKIVGSTLYLLTTIPDSKGQNRLLTDIETVAHLAHDLALKSLKDNPFSARQCLYNLATAHIGLDSKLAIARTTALLSPDLVAVLSAEIDSVLRHLAGYLKTADANAEINTKPNQIQSPLVSTVSKDATTSSPSPTTKPTTPAGSTGHQARRQQIISILQGKDPVSIKDITDSVTDCGPKTIQRELNHLIKDRLVIKIGDRRWSKYALRQS